VKSYTREKLAFDKFGLAKHNILTLKENTIIAYVKFALQKMPLKEGKTYTGIQSTQVTHISQKGCVCERGC
jgi:hypothetical protein